MDNIHQYTDGVAANAVLLCGFTAFFAIEPDLDTPLFLSVCYFVSSTLSLVCNMYVVVCSSLLGALGPTYGLNGSGITSMHDAVVLMKKERKKMLRGFELGAFFFGVCQLCATWIVAGLVPSITCSIILFIGFVYISAESKRLKREFKFNEFHEEEVRGALIFYFLASKSLTPICSS